MISSYGYRLDDEEHLRLQEQAQRARDREEQLWPRLGVSAGARVADLGCGPGATLLDLVPLVGPRGELVGVDASPAAVARARSDATAADAGDVLQVQEGPAWASGLTPATFDVVIIRLLLLFNGGREQDIVDHAVSLLRPGGHVYLYELDLTLLKIHPPCAPITELYACLERFERSRGNDVSIGMRLPELLAGAGAEVVDYYGACVVASHEVTKRGPAWSARQAMVDAGQATPADLTRWEAEFEQLAAQSIQPRFVSCGFTGIGRRSIEVT